MKRKSMLEVSLIADGKAFPCPIIYEGMPPSSITDYTVPEGEVILFGIEQQGKGAYVAVSKAGVAVDIGPYTNQGQMQFLSSYKLKKEKTLLPGESYERDIKTKYAAGKLVFTFTIQKI